MSCDLSRLDTRLITSSVSVCVCVCKIDEAVRLIQGTFDEMERGSASVCHPGCVALLRACVSFLCLSDCVCVCVCAFSLPDNDAWRF